MAARERARRSPRPDPHRPTGLAAAPRELAALYFAAQCLGGLVAQLLPYIWENPQYGTEPGVVQWEFRYVNFALQGVVIYGAVCAATAWYACRLRQLRED